MCEHTCTSSVPSLPPSLLVSLSSLPQGLSRVYHTELMPFLRSLDLSRNQLATLHEGENLLCLHTLIMDDNKLEELPPCIGQLQALRVLSIRNNSILTF